MGEVGGCVGHFSLQLLPPFGLPLLRPRDAVRQLGDLARQPPRDIRQTKRAFERERRGGSSALQLLNE